MTGLRKDFTTITWVMIPVAIAINIAVGQITYTLKVPLYLDAIGTILVGVLAGPWAGALTGLLTNFVWGLTGLNVTYAPFAAVAAVIGMMAGLLAEAGWFRVWWKAILGGLITGLIAAVISAPIAAYVWGGVTGAGTDVIVAIFRAMGFGILPSSFAQGVSSDPLDKMISFFVVFLILKALPLRFLARFPRAENVMPAAAQEPTAPAA